MQRYRFRLWDLAFILILLVSVPAAIYHILGGRWANAAMAIGALIVGVAVLYFGFRHTEVEAPVRATGRRATRAPRARHLPWREPNGRAVDWLPLGVISGFAATALMTLILVVGYGIAAALGSAAPGASTLQRWMSALVDNTLTRGTQANLATALVIHFVAGIAWAILYAALVEPRLSGPSWRRGLEFALLPWLFSLIVFLPAAGAGFLGLGLGAGPLPLIGNLILHAVYGVTLGEVFVSEGLQTESGEAEDAQEAARLAHLQRVMALAIIPGLLIGGLVGLLGSDIFAPGQSPGLVAVFGAIVGCAVAIVVGSFFGVSEAAQES